MPESKAVADSSVLITFAKSKKLDWLLDAFDSPLLISSAVFEEAVTRGLEKREPDARLIDGAVRRGAIVVTKVKKKMDFPFLDSGEASVLSQAMERKISVVCIDESPARKAAKSMGLAPIGTLGVMGLLLRHKRVNQLQMLAAVDDMVQRDFRISAKILEKFRREITML